MNCEVNVHEPGNAVKPLHLLCDTNEQVPVFEQPFPGGFAAFLADLLAASQQSLADLLAGSPHSLRKGSAFPYVVLELCGYAAEAEPQTTTAQGERQSRRLEID